MAQSRLFVNNKLSPGVQLLLGSEQTRYVGRALRLRVGDTLTVFNGEDGEYSARLVTIAKDSASVRVVSHFVVAPESPLSVHLVQSSSSG